MAKFEPVEEKSCFPELIKFITKIFCGTFKHYNYLIKL